MFQTSILRKYLHLLNDQVTQKAYEKFIEIFLNPEKQGNFRSLSENQYQEGFCRELFCQCLGYTIAPDPGFNFKTEQRNQTASSDKYGNRNADAAILLPQNPIAPKKVFPVGGDLEGAAKVPLPNGEGDLGGEARKKNSKRKKDGVFYTPAYITKYIVENTVGRLVYDLYGMTDEEIAIVEGRES